MTPSDAQVWAVQNALSRYGYITTEDVFAALNAADIAKKEACNECSSGDHRPV